MNFDSFRFPCSRIWLGAGLLLAPAGLAAAELQPATLKAWTSYVAATERRFGAELGSGRDFLALDFQAAPAAALERRAVLSGGIPVSRMETLDPLGCRIPVPDGMIHHWRGSMFIRGGRLEEILSRVTNPLAADMRQEDVLRSDILERGPDSLKIFLKLQRSTFVTVVYNTVHSVQVQRYSGSRASSRSVAIRIVELEAPNSTGEREKPEGQDRGFLWRLNSYWRYEQAPGGVIVECESLSLSRGVPYVLEALVRPLIDSTARESMQRILGSMRDRMAHREPVSHP